MAYSTEELRSIDVPLPVAMHDGLTGLFREAREHAALHDPLSLPRYAREVLEAHVAAHVGPVFCMTLAELRHYRDMGAEWDSLRRMASQRRGPGRIGDLVIPAGKYAVRYVDGSGNRYWRLYDDPLARVAEVLA